MNVVAPSVTTTTGCARVVGLFSSFSASSMTPPAGMTERFDVVTSEPAWDINVSVADQVQNVPAATGTRTATATVADVNIGALVALRANGCSPGVSFPLPAQTGFTGGGNVDTTDPWFATNYSFGATNTTQPGALKVSTVNHLNAPLLSTPITFVRDVTAPAGGALTVNGTAASAGGTSSDAGGTFTIGTRTDYTETQGAAASGLASSTLTRDSATYTNGVCGTYSGSPTTIVGNPNQTLATGCYRFVLTGLDNVGNTVSLTTDVRVHGAATQIGLTGAVTNLTSGADPRADGDDQGRQRQRRGHQLVHRDHVLEAVRRRHRQRHRHRDGDERRCDEDDHRRARRRGRHGSNSRRPRPPARSAPSTSSTAQRRRSR